MADRDPQATGTQIANRRHVLGWTQIELAERLGVSPSTVADWERGVSYPKKKRGKVEQVLGISLETGSPLPVARDDWEAAILEDPELPDHEKRDVIRRSRRIRAELYPGPPVPPRGAPQQPPGAVEEDPGAA